MAIKINANGITDERANGARNHVNMRVQLDLVVRVNREDAEAWRRAEDAVCQMDATAGDYAEAVGLALASSDAILPLNMRILRDNTRKGIAAIDAAENFDLASAEGGRNERAKHRAAVLAAVEKAWAETKPTATLPADPLASYAE